jgi:TM2 domain-containing membrane protein YozV
VDIGEELMPPGKKNQDSPPPVVYNYFAGLLSYLIPGLGQIYQGRVGKGLLFLACIYGLFGYGLFLGQWRNVFIISNPKELPKVSLPLFGPQDGVVKALYHRPQFVGQFWTGVVAWPAIWQYRNPAEILEVADPEKRDQPEEITLRNFQRQPSEKDLNQLQTQGSKTWDLAWVFTVIAGVLNIMVIYDAAAGPAFRFADNANSFDRVSSSAMRAPATTA